MNVNPLIPHVKKYLDWKSWFVGMYVKAIQSATSAALGWVGTNMTETIAPDMMANLGMTWKQAICAFLAVMAIEVIRYINGKPIPDAIEKAEQEPQ